MMGPKMSAEYAAKCNNFKRPTLALEFMMINILNPQVREALYSEDAHANAFWRAAVPVFLLL